MQIQTYITDRRLLNIHGVAESDVWRRRCNAEHYRLYGQLTLSDLLKSSVDRAERNNGRNTGDKEIYHQRVIGNKPTRRPKYHQVEENLERLIAGNWKARRYTREELNQFLEQDRTLNHRRRPVSYTHLDVYKRQGGKK